MLTDPGTLVGDGDYIGEFSFGEGELGLDTDVERRLFTLRRTGLLGAMLLGRNMRYLFDYHKDGYKTGRHYSASCLQDQEGLLSNMLCSFIMSVTNVHILPFYACKAISDEEKRICDALIKIKRSENHD